MGRPPSDNPVVKKTVSMSRQLRSAALRNAAKRGFGKSFSAYVAWLLERDNAGGVEREKLRKGV